MTDLNLNFRWVSSAQNLSADTEAVKATEGMARILIRDVALSVEETYYQEAQRSLVRQVREAVSVEADRMARAIGRGISLPDKYTGPHGSMQIKGGLSKTAATAGFKNYAHRQDTKVRWDKRDKRYLDWKRSPKKKYRGQTLGRSPDRWWELTGELQQYFSSRSKDFYSRTFGAINVMFFKNKGAKPDAAKVTKSGRTGRPTQYTFTLGRLEITAFNRITPAMLPALASGNWADVDNGGAPGIAQLLPQLGPGGVRDKLLRTNSKTGGRTRKVLEPFVSYYLTRAIPNAVWRRVEAFTQG